MLLQTSVAVAVTVAALGVQTQFRAATDIVDVYATVRLRSGAIADDLTRADFQLFEDGKPREISIFSHSVQPLSVALLLDQSGSTVNDRADILLAAQEFVGRLLRTDRTSVSTLSWECQDFTADSRTLLTVLRMKLPGDSGSPIWAATDRAMSRLSGEPGRRIILLFSDGMDTQQPRAGPLPAAPSASALPVPTPVPTTPLILRAPVPPNSFQSPCTWAHPAEYRSLDDVVGRAAAEGVMVYAVSVKATGNSVMTGGGGALEKLSKETGTQYHRLGNYSEVKAVFKSIADELHLQYLLGFVPTGTDGKPHSIEVKVNRFGVTVLARKSYIAAKK